MPPSIKTFRQVLIAAAVVTAPLAAPRTSAAGGDTGVMVKPVAAHDLPNLPGKRFTAIVVTYAPGAKSARHHHAGSVWVYVLSGAIRSQNSATGPAKVYQAGESFFEASISSARTPARPSRQACSPSTSPNTARS